MIIFVVPAYNEEQNIGSLLEQTRTRMRESGHTYQVLIVDDGSRDRTAEIAQSYASTMPIRIIRHERNRGVGQVFRTGLAAALEVAGDDDVIVTKEADNTSTFDILEAMVQRVKAGDDVVLASCFAEGGRIVGSTLGRHLLSFGANLLVRTFASIPNVNTYSSFYRAFRAGTLRCAVAAYGDRFLAIPGFACMVEMLIKLSRLPLRISEVPMTLQSDLRKGASKMRRARTIVEYVILLARDFARSRAEDRRIREAFDAARSAAMATETRRADDLPPASVSVLVPVHNEERFVERCLSGMLEALKALGVEYEVVVCENGSADRTPEITLALQRSWPRLVLECLPEANYGLALKHGIARCRNDVVIIFNIDFWSAEFMRLALERLQEFDLVVGSKVAPGANDERPILRRLITRSFNGLLRLLFGFRGTDTHGIKAFRRTVLLPISQACLTDGSIFDTELVLRAERAGLRIVEVPIGVRELRQPRYFNLVKRIPETARNLVTLCRVLESRPRS